MKSRILTGSGLALLFTACMVIAALPWLALACAAAALGIGCYLHSRRGLVHTDALHLGRIVMLPGAAMTFLAALVATDSPLSWVVIILSTLPILPAYYVGFYGLVLGYTVGYFILLGVISASRPDEPTVNSRTTSRE